MTDSIFPYARWTERLATLRERFAAAQPFPHVVLDEFLAPDAAQRCVRAFPPLETDGWIHYTHFNEYKFGQPDRHRFPPDVGAVVDELNSPSFVEFLEALTGIRGLLADAGLMGGGLHQSPVGGYLNVHADFTGHPHEPSWRRRLNLLLYLNPGWQDSYGGFLELWDSRMERCVHRIAPAFNRAVVFCTDADAFHGHPDPLTCPPGVTRRSVALYYFTAEREPFRVHATHYRARPGEGAKAVPIWLDMLALRVFDGMKRRFGLSDRVGSDVLKRVWPRHR